MESPTEYRYTEGFTGRQWRILILLACCNFLSAIVQSLQAPFYPAEAEKKGATPTEYGFVFGIYEFVAFLVCPVISSVIHKFPPISAFAAGYLTVAGSTTMFGFLDRINDHATFISASFALRTMEAIGGALVFISNYTFITISFPSSIATVFAVMETAFAVGIAAGPAFGGILFQIGGKDFGFTLPFLVMGMLLFFTSPLAMWILPKVEHERNENGGESGSNYGFFKLLKYPSIVLYTLSVMSASLCSGFLASTLEPHLRQFSLPPIMVGLMFLIYGGVYAVMSPILGYICDRISEPNRVTFVGSLCVLISYTTLGPVVLLPINPSLPLIGISLALFGFGTASILVSAFLLMLRDALNNGFVDNPATTSSVTGLWLSSMSLGGFIGPSLGGLLLDAYGFRVGTLFNVALFIIITSLLLWSILARRSLSTSSERISLLSSEEEGSGTGYSSDTTVGPVSQIGVKMT